MRNSTLHAILEAFTSDAAGRLQAETVGGAEVPFEVTEERGGKARLYCYRPLTGLFIDDRLMMLRALPTYAPAVRALADLESIGAYLQQRGEPRAPGEPRERADLALKLFLSAVFAERNQFGFEPRRFEEAYVELERALYDGRCVSNVIAPLLGIRLDEATAELALGDGLSLMRGETLPDAPADAVWDDRDEPNVLATLSLVQERALRPPVSAARARFRRILTALRLFERGGYALGPIAWARSDSGPWRTVPLGATGRPRFTTVISAAQEDELRGFFNLIAKRAPSNGELAWALARFEMGCERLAPFEALTDYLLASRALLEPEGPASGRLAYRLAAICATPEDRAALAERTAHVISLERAVIAGLAPAEPGADALVEELAENLRALLRDMICGHLDPDVRTVADELLQEAVAAPLQEAVAAPLRRDEVPHGVAAKLRSVFHVELRRFPHVARTFNLDQDELLARYVMPWISGSAITLDDRRWSPDKKTRLTVYDAPAIAPEERGLGRGWSTVTREGRNVTNSVLDEATKVMAPPVPLAELKASLVAAAQVAPVPAREAVAMAGGRGRTSERLALAEQAVWELLHEGQLSLADGDGPVGQDRWESLLLAWETWSDPGSAVALRTAGR